MYKTIIWNSIPATRAGASLAIDIASQVYTACTSEFVFCALNAAAPSIDDLHKLGVSEIEYSSFMEAIPTEIDRRLADYLENKILDEARMLLGGLAVAIASECIDCHIILQCTEFWNTLDWFFASRLQQEASGTRCIVTIENNSSYSRKPRPYCTGAWSYLVCPEELMIPICSPEFFKSYPLLVFGALSISPHLVWRRLLELANIYATEPLLPKDSWKHFLYTARFALELRIDSNHDYPERFFTLAYRATNDQNNQILVLRELANFYANQKYNQLSLRKAAKLLGKALQKTLRLTHGYLKNEHLARCYNTLALVEYHSGRSEKALHLEQVAKSILRREAEDGLVSQAGLESLLNRNISQLLLRRYNRTSEAIQCLTENIESDKLPANEKIIDILRLAEVLYDEKMFGKVVDLLKPVCFDLDIGKLVTSRELEIRVFFALSLWKSDRQDLVVAQVPKIKALSRCSGAVACIRLAELLSN